MGSTTHRKNSRGAKKTPRPPRTPRLPRVVRPVAVKKRPAPAAPAPRRARHVLVATDGTQPASSALRMASLMADRGAWIPEVLTVCEPLPVSIGEMALPEPVVQQEVAMTDSLLAGIRQQLRRLGAGSWGLSVRYGRPAPLIVRAARDHAADLIVIGLGHHRAVARLFGAETAARVVRHTDIPVLAVHESARGLPRTAVVAVDFGDSSVRAAHEALSLLEAPARLHLVHVKWGYNTTSLRDSEWERAYNFGVERGFERLRGDLEVPPGVEVTMDFIHGAVVSAILDTARELDADLVALGSHSQTVVDRLVIGSTPAEVLRDAPCSVLIAPPADTRT